MTGKIFIFITAVVLLSTAADAQEKFFARYVRNNTDGSQTLLKHLPKEVSMGRAQKRAHANSSQMLDLRIVLPSKDQPGLDRFIKELYDPRSPNYHKFLTPSQFNLMYGGSSTDSAIVAQYLKSKGMRVKQQSKNSLILTVAGQVSAVEPAFKVNINNYRRADGSTFFSPDANPTLAPQVAGKIFAVVGMDNAVRFFPHSHLKKQLLGNNPLTVNPPVSPVIAVRGPNGILVAKTSLVTKALAPAFTGVGGSIGPSDIATAYNLNTVASTGSGQTMAVFELDGYLAGDVTAFENNYSLPNVTLTNVIDVADGANGSAGADTGEVVLDIDLAIAVAPGLSNILVYEAPNSASGWIDQWNKIASDDLAHVISCSWGAYEDGTYPFYDHTVFSQLAAQGQTVFASTGDAGAYDNCDGGTLPPSCTQDGDPATGVLSIDDPASDPYVTGAGISALTTNVNGSYNSETASLYGGGGISNYVAIPSFQTTMASQANNAALVSTTMRNLPDVVFTADPSTVYGISLSGTWYGYWGSSASSPIWAAFMSRVNQGRAAAGQSVLGFLNPLLYQVAQSTRYSSDFHDITTGDNSHYPAKAGFDDATGLGSFNGANLYADLIGPAAPGGLGHSIASGQIGLNWTASAGGASYNVKRGTVSGGPYTTISTSGAVTGTSYTDSTVTSGTTYYYVVSAVNSAGIEGLNSAQTSGTAASVPTAPTAVSATAGTTQATVTFSGALAQGSAITGYTVTSSPGNITGTGASSPIVVTGLTNGTAYTFTVTATNAMGTGSASAASNSVTPFGLPSAPTTVTAVAGNTQATVTFSGATANGSAITSYTVTSLPGSFTGSGASSPITVTGLTNGTAYTFTVTATNGAGTSSASGASNSVTPNIVPAAPTAVSAVRGDTQAVVSFSAPAPNGGTAVLSYTVTSSPGNITATGASSPITVAGLTNGTAYTFTVVATNATGPGAVSAASNSVTPAGLPVAPTTVTAAAGNTQAVVTFSGATANGSAITSYTVTSSPGSFTGSGATSPVTVTGLTNGTAYTFTVTATNGVGTSSASGASNSVTPNIVPAAPTAVSAVRGDTQAVVSFSAPAPNGGTAVLSYTVTSSPGNITATGASSPITVAGLTNGTAYTFTVVAANAMGPGAASAASNSVTPAGLPVAPTTVTAARGDTQAIVTFSGATANGSAITSYTVTSSPGNLTGSGATSPVTVTGLTNGTAYTFTVTATNAIGTSSASAASNSVTPAGLPTAPTTVTAVAGNTQAAITFSGATANGSAITSYSVTSSPGNITASGASSPITVTGLTNGTAYTFTVTATNGVGTSSASAASNSVTPVGPPTAPTTVTAARGDTQAVITFSGSTANGSAITGYTVTSSPGNITGTGASSPIVVTGLTNGTAYTFTVTATNGVGTSSASAASNSVTPAGLPVAPTTVTAVAGNTQATVTFSGATANGSAITGYTVTSSPGNITGTGASSPIVVTGLTNGTAYTFTVTATNGVGTSSASGASNSVTPNIVPAAPTAVSAVRGDTQAVVSFSAPAPNGGTAVLSYTVTSSPGNITATGASSPITVAGLTNGTAYTFTVVAANATGPGAVSAASNSVTPAGLPVAPTTVTAARGDTQAVVTFSGAAANGSAITSYTVTSSPGSFTGSGATSPVTVTGLTNGTAYTFTVTATNAIGTSSASAASNSVTPAGLPTAPTTVTAARGDTQATITFGGASANGSAITGYTVRSSPGNFTGSGATSPVTVTGLTNGTAYTFTVTATSGVGTSSASAASNSVTPAGLPTAPTTVSASASDAQAVVTFSGATANGSAITSYTVTSSPGSITASGASSPIVVTGLTNGTTYTFTVTATNVVGTGPSSAASNSVEPGLPTAPTAITAARGDTQAVVTFSGALGNGSAITNYTVTSSPGNITGSGASSPVTVTGLTNGTAYTFTVKATNGIGISPASSASNSVTPAGLPLPPTTVTATGGDTHATVTFSGAAANGSAITGYTVTSSPGNFIGTGASSPITVNGLTNGTAYTFTVTAANGVGAGAASAASNGVTPAGLPFAPTTVSAAGGDTQAVVTFSGALPNGSSITGYTVTSSPGNFIGTGASSPIVVTGLSNGTSYTFTVKAINSVGTGLASAATNSVTPAGPPIPPTTVSAQGGNTQAVVSFSGGSANGSAITSYTVTSSPDGITASGPSSPITVTGLTNGTVYTFTVTASNVLGTSPTSPPTNSVTPSPVVPPSALNMTILGARVGGHIVYGGVVLTWAQSTSPGIIQNKIYRSTGAGPYTLVAVISASTTYTDTTAARGATYNYEVTAFDSNQNESTPSNSTAVNY